MKNKIIMTCLILFFSVTHTINAFAEWQATVHAEGKNLGGQYKSDITIGVASEAKAIAAPPEAPNFTCSMVIMSSDWKTTLATDIRQESQATNSWVIVVNPHGNMGSPDDATSFLSWNSDEFARENCELRKGWDGTGEFVVTDMKMKNRIDITGGNEIQYFTLICK